MPPHVTDPLRWAVLAGSVLVACLGGCGLELPVERHENPVVVAAGERAYLFVQVRGGGGERRCLCLVGDDGRWVRLCDFRADYTCAAGGGGRFWLFLTESVIELQAETCVKTGESPWDLGWKVQSAYVADGVLTAFGVNGSGGLCVASARLAGAGGVRGVTTEPAGARATTEPAGAGRREGLLTGGWVQRVVKRKEQGGATKVRTTVAGGRVWVFWTTTEKGMGERLWAAWLGPYGLEDEGEIGSFGEGGIEFAAVPAGEEPMVIYGRMPACLRGESSLSYRVRAKGLWPPHRRAEQVRNAYGEQTRSLSAAAAGGKVYLVLGTELRVLGTTYEDGDWGPLRKVLGDERLDWAIEHVGLLVVLGAVGLAALLGSLVRSSMLPRRVVIGGVEYVLGAWWRRAAGYAVDFVVSVTAVMAMHAIAGRAPTEASVMIGVFGFEMVYFSAWESRAGKTLGKRLVGVIVVSRNGGYPTWGEAALRNLPRALADAVSLGPVAWLVGSVVLLNTRGSQRLGDLAAGTYVVRERPAK